MSLFFFYGLPLGVIIMITHGEIRRVFSYLMGKRWICCTTHFVQKHCTVEDLEFAFDLMYRLAREG